MASCQRSPAAVSSPGRAHTAPYVPPSAAAAARRSFGGAAACLERLGAGSGFRLLPYQAVGVSGGLLLCFQQPLRSQQQPSHGA